MAKKSSLPPGKKVPAPRKCKPLQKAKPRQRRNTAPTFDYVAVNANGRRIGETHPRARYCDYEIDMVWALHEEGWGYGRISVAMEMSKSQVRRILRGENRAQAARLVRRG